MGDPGFILAVSIDRHRIALEKLTAEIALGSQALALLALEGEPLLRQAGFQGGAGHDGAAGEAATGPGSTDQRAPSRRPSAAAA